MRLLLLALGGLLPVVVLAEPVDFAIPAQPANQALLAFSKQAGMEVLFPSEELRQVRSTEVVGRFERDQALVRLLKGTGFIARQNGRGAFVITAGPRPAKPAATSASPAKAPAPEETTRLAPYLVRGQSTGGLGLTQMVQTPIGDVDLPRTENDALPYEVYGSERIATSGAVNLSDFLRQEVLEGDAAAPPLNEAGGQLAAFNDGSANLNLRGFGSDETVVLLNGLPMPQMLSGTQDGSTTREADVNLIPMNLVERIEILPVSASALYSGNPVGGVINIVLRPIENLDQVTATYSNGVRVDAPQSSYSFVHGQTLLGGKLSFRLDANYTRNTPPTESELGYIKANLAAHPDLNVPLNYPDTSLERATPNIVSDAGLPLFGPGTPTYTSVAPGADGSGGLAAFTGRQGLPSTALFQAPGGNSDSPNALNYAYGRKQASSTYFGSLTYDLSSKVQIGWTGLYSHTVTNPGYDVFQGTLQLPANSPMNPFNQLVDVNLNETAPALGQGYDEAHIDLYSVVFGALIKLPRDWRLSLDGQYTRALTSYRGLAGVDPVQWQNLVDEGLYNPLRDTQVYGPPAAFYQQALIYYGGPGQFITLDNDQTIDTAVRITNSALPLPTGTGAVNAGTDYSIAHSANFNDDQRFGDGTVADTSGEWVGRTLQTYSAFAEFQAPLLPERWLPAWIHRLGADAAARYNASNVPYGTNVSPTFGFKADLAGGLALRASISHTNRFPTSALNHFDPVPGGIGSGGGPNTDNLIIDPLRGDSQYYVTSSDLPVTDLHPEADITQSAGLVFRRGDVHRFRLSVDFFDTRKTGELDDFGAQDIIDVESLLPGRVTRAAPTPGDPYAVGPIISVLTGAIPVAWRHSQNWNTSLDYDWTECAGGTFQVYVRWAYFEKYARAVLSTSAPVDELNDPDTSSLDLLRNRINFGAAWSNPHIGFGVDGEYFAPRVIPTNLQVDQGGRAIDSFMPFAAYVKGDLTRFIPWKTSRIGVTGQLRVNNIFSASLPAFPDSPSGTGVEPYADWRGQVYSLSLTVSY